MAVKTESEIIEDLKQIIDPTVKSYEIKVVKRVFTARAEYIAKIGVISTEGLIDYVTIKNLVNFIMNGEHDDLEIDGTDIDMKDLKYDVLVISAKINIE